MRDSLLKRGMGKGFRNTHTDTHTHTHTHTYYREKYTCTSNTHAQILHVCIYFLLEKLYIKSLKNTYVNSHKYTDLSSKTIGADTSTCMYSSFFHFCVGVRLVNLDVL